MRERYERDLNVLHDEILKMGLMVERALIRALDAMRSGDSDAAEAVVSGDAEIDAQEGRIEELCTLMIAREQPVAGDLRDIMTVLKISSELERMGDHARSLAKRTGLMGTPELSRVLPDFDRMMAEVLSMMKEALEAFADMDADTALNAASRDAEVDRIHDEVYGKILESLNAGASDVNRQVPILFLNRFIERLGDRVTNMCEWIYYARTGERLEMNRSPRL